MTNEEYVAELRAGNAKPFVEDCRDTFQLIHIDLDRQQQDHETPIAFRARMARARARLERLMLRIQDGRT